MSAAENATELSFEAAMRELEGIVSDLEKGNVDLDKSIALYERGEFLKKHCDSLLKSAGRGSRKSSRAPTAPPRASRRSTWSERQSQRRSLGDWLGANATPSLREGLEVKNVRPDASVG